MFAQPKFAGDRRVCGGLFDPACFSFGSTPVGTGRLTDVVEHRTKLRRVEPTQIRCRKDLNEFVFKAPGAALPDAGPTCDTVRFEPGVDPPSIEERAEQHLPMIVRQHVAVPPCRMCHRGDDSGARVGCRVGQQRVDGRSEMSNLVAVGEPVRQTNHSHTSL